MTVFLLVPRAIYDHGVIGVYSSEERAREAAEEIWPQTDGHHKLVIVPMEVDGEAKDVFEKAMTFWADASDPGLIQIEVED